MDAMKQVKPSILLGLSGCGGLFQEELIREMSKHCEEPIIFPPSNPTSSAECSNAQAIEWSDGRCVFASGSPFDPVEYNGTTYSASQCNNMYIFPGIGLGAVQGKCSKVSDGMIYASSQAVAASLSAQDIDTGMVFPDISRIREVSLNVGVNVIIAAVEEGLAKDENFKNAENEKDVREMLLKKMYDPVYVPLVWRDPAI